MAQSVILTRLEGGKTPMPPREKVREFARHGTTMALFLSAARGKQLQEELLAGGYDPQTPCVVAYQATWPDELIVHCVLADLEATLKEHKLYKHTLVLVGPPCTARRAPAHTSTTPATSTSTARPTRSPARSCAHNGRSRHDAHGDRSGRQRGCRPRREQRWRTPHW